MLEGLLRVQSMGLLPDQEDAEAVGKVLRFCPGLNKVAIGELLGENDDFHLAVLDHFTRTFQFESEPSHSHQHYDGHGGAEPSLWQ